uniref:Uncharacterized protein n=1 Tax=Arundo donax TaxID=35708 RepID=A0A0A9AST3_ARUDO
MIAKQKLNPAPLIYLL